MNSAEFQRIENRGGFGAVSKGESDRRGDPGAVAAASSPDPVKHAAVLGPIKAKPCGWPRKGGQP